jgi:PIN domain nuclease of toxin-antitoxin system
MLLLDTHVLLWWLADDPRLGRATRDLVADPDHLVVVSAATAWEIAIKKALGRLEAPDELAVVLEENDFDPLPISVHHALAAGALPRHHDDPFDRMLVAQARLESLHLVTADARLGAYGVSLLAAEE